MRGDMSRRIGRAIGETGVGVAAGWICMMSGESLQEPLLAHSSSIRKALRRATFQARLISAKIAA